MGKHLLVIKELFFIGRLWRKQVLQVCLVSPRVDFQRRFQFETEQGLVNGVVEVLCCLDVLLILILDIADVVVADTSSFVVLPIKHVAGFS